MFHQRGELALTLLTHYKDDQDKLARIMDKLLDKEVHQMYKAPSLPTYYVNNAPSQVRLTKLVIVRILLSIFLVSVLNMLVSSCTILIHSPGVDIQSSIANLKSRETLTLNH